MNVASPVPYLSVWITIDDNHSKTLGYLGQIGKVTIANEIIETAKDKISLDT